MIKFDGLDFTIFDYLCAPAYYQVDDQGKISALSKPISWSSYLISYVPTNLKTFICRLGYWIKHRTWENNATLLNHLIQHIKTKESDLSIEEYKKIKSIYKKIIAHTGMTKEATQFKSDLRVLKPESDPSNDEDEVPEKSIKYQSSYQSFRPLDNNINRLDVIACKSPYYKYSENTTLENIEEIKNRLIQAEQEGLRLLTEEEMVDFEVMQDIVKYRNEGLDANEIERLATYLFRNFLSHSYTVDFITDYFKYTDSSTATMQELDLARQKRELIEELHTMFKAFEQFFLVWKKDIKPYLKPEMTQEIQTMYQDYEFLYNLLKKEETPPIDDQLDLSTMLEIVEEEPVPLTVEDLKDRDLKEIKNLHQNLTLYFAKTSKVYEQLSKLRDALE